jgi:hypothetical protein
LKRASITRPSPVRDGDGPRRDVARVTIIRASQPANNPPDRPGPVLALIDDLAALAAELYFVGRLDVDAWAGPTKGGNKPEDKEV